jgi:hypothetical protein
VSRAGGAGGGGQPPANHRRGLGFKRPRTLGFVTRARWTGGGQSSSECKLGNDAWFWRAPTEKRARHGQTIVVLLPRGGTSCRGKTHMSKGLPVRRRALSKIFCSVSRSRPLLAFSAQGLHASSSHSRVQGQGRGFRIWGLGFGVWGLVLGA